MALLMTRQYMTLGILMLLTWVTVVVRPPMRMASLPRFQVPAMSLQAPSRSATLKKHIVAQPVPAPVVQPVDPNAFGLRSSAQDYSYVFSGKILCGDAPCEQASVRVLLESTHDSKQSLETPVRPDGTYSVAITLKDVPQGTVDWSVVADNLQRGHQEVSGRQILTDETSLALHSILQLQ